MLPMIGNIFSLYCWKLISSFLKVNCFRSISNSFMAKHLKKGGIILAYVNKNYLHTKVLDFFCCVPTEAYRDFIGHYILLCHYSKSDDSFLYLDPSTQTHAYSKISADSLNHARTTIGTNEDMIFIFKKL